MSGFVRFSIKGVGVLKPPPPQPFPFRPFSVGLYRFFEMDCNCRRLQCWKMGVGKGKVYLLMAEETGGGKCRAQLVALSRISMEIIQAEGYMIISVGSVIKNRLDKCLLVGFPTNPSDCVSISGFSGRVYNNRSRDI